MVRSDSDDDDCYLIDLIGFIIKASRTLGRIGGTSHTYIGGPFPPMVGVCS